MVWQVAAAPEEALEIFTFADLLTAPGSMAAAAFLTTAGLVLVTFVPPVAKLVEANWIAVGLSIILYVLAYFVLDPGPDGILGLLISWVSCSASILGIKYSLVVVKQHLPSFA